MVQLEEIIPPQELYNEDYIYLTSTSKTLVNHYAESAREIIKSKNLDSKGLVFEIGSNDGHMLEVFQERGIPVLGIDPALKPAEIANQRGIPTICDFFTTKLAHRQSRDGTEADVVISN